MMESCTYCLGKEEIFSKRSSLQNCRHWACSVKSFSFDDTATYLYASVNSCLWINSGRSRMNESDFLGRTMAHQWLDAIPRVPAMDFTSLFRSQTASKDLEVQDRLGRSLLHIACMKTWYAGARWLIECGSPVDATTTYGHPPLHYAAVSGTISMCRLLLRYKERYNVEQRDNIGLSARDYAFRCGFSAIATLLYDGVQNVGDTSATHASTDRTASSLPSTMVVEATALDDSSQMSSDPSTNCHHPRGINETVTRDPYVDAYGLPSFMDRTLPPLDVARNDSSPYNNYMSEFKKTCTSSKRNPQIVERHISQLQDRRSPEEQRAARLALSGVSAHDPIMDEPQEPQLEDLPFQDEMPKDLLAVFDHHTSSPSHPLNWPLLRQWSSKIAMVRRGERVITPEDVEQQIRRNLEEDQGVWGPGDAFYAH